MEDMQWNALQLNAMQLKKYNAWIHYNENNGMNSTECNECNTMNVVY